MLRTAETGLNVQQNSSSVCLGGILVSVISGNSAILDGMMLISRPGPWSCFQTGLVYVVRRCQEIPHVVIFVIYGTRDPLWFDRETLYFPENYCVTLLVEHSSVLDGRTLGLAS